MPKSHKPKPTEPHPFGNRARSFSLLLCLGALAGVLIWAKLRLVTDIPRSAYADPREVMTPDPNAGPSVGVEPDWVVDASSEMINESVDAQVSEEGSPPSLDIIPTKP